MPRKTSTSKPTMNLQIQRKSAPVVTGLKYQRIPKKNWFKSYGYTERMMVLKDYEYNIFRKNGGVIKRKSTPIGFETKTRFINKRGRRYMATLKRPLVIGQKSVWKLVKFNRVMKRKVKRQIGVKNITLEDIWEFEKFLIGQFNKRRIGAHQIANNLLLIGDVSMIDHRTVDILDFIGNQFFQTIPNIFSMAQFPQSYTSQQLDDLACDKRLRHIDDPKLARHVVQFTTLFRLIDQHEVMKVFEFMVANIGQDPNDFTVKLLSRFPLRKLYENLHVNFVGLFIEACHSMNFDSGDFAQILDERQIEKFEKANLPLASIEHTNSIIRFFIKKILNPHVDAHPLWTPAQVRYAKELGKPILE